MSNDVKERLGETSDKTEWRNKMTELGGELGFYRELGDYHDALHVKKGDTLIVTFENLDHVYEMNESRMPWGFDFVTKQGWSMLGLMAHDWTWYRDEHVYDFFDELRDSGFFDQFKRVIFYGASMGGYAACAFSAAAKNSIVIAISPQSTLDRNVTPWERRYGKAWNRNFQNRYGFAPDSVAQVKKCYLFYDPSEALDTGHAAHFRSSNVRAMRCRFLGHRIASLLQQMGVLKTVIMDCVNDELTDKKFYGYLRARRESPRYRREMLARLENKRRDELLITYCQAILSRQRAPAFRKAMNAAIQREKQRKGRA